MSNGPMGGFMPTPAAPAQPPTVKLDTTALSRGNFNNFLKNMSGASSLNPPMAPQMGAMMSPSLAPSVSDIDIFNPPMQMMQGGGNVAPRQAEIMGQPHMLAYITPQEGDILESLGGANEPGPMGIPSFFDTGEGMGGYGSDDSAVSGNDDDNDDNQSFVDDDPIAGNDFEVISTPIVTEDERQQNIADSEQFILDTPSIPNVTFNNESIENAFKNLNIPSKVQKELRDGLQEDAKNNNLIGALDAFQKESAEFDGKSLGLQVINNIIQASGVNPAEFSRKAFNQEEILGDADVRAGVGLDKNIDVFENTIDRNFARSLPGANLPIVDSTRNTVKEDQAKALINLVGDRDDTITNALQQNVKEQQEALAAQRGRALGPINFRDDAADVIPENFRGQTPIEISRVGDDQLAIDEAERAIQDRIDQDRRVQELLDRGQLAERDKADRIAAAQAMGVGISPTSTRRDGLSEGEIDQDESIRTMSPGESRARFGGGLGEIVSGLEDGFQKDIVELANRKPSINVSGIFGKALNLPETFTRDRMVDALTTNRGKRFFGGTYEPKPIYQDGKIVGIKDQYGNLMEGIDPFAPDTGSNENEDPVIRPIIPIKKEEEETKSSAPNVFGGLNPFLPPQSPVVVDSPFTTNVGDFKGTGFSTGDLNRLIAQLTGIRSPRSMAKGGVAEFADGGLIKAVDDFLSTGQ